MIIKIIIGIISFLAITLMICVDEDLHLKKWLKLRINKTKFKKTLRKINPRIWWESR